MPETVFTDKRQFLAIRTDLDPFVIGEHFFVYAETPHKARQALEVRKLSRAELMDMMREVIESETAGEAGATT